MSTERTQHKRRSDLTPLCLPCLLWLLAAVPAASAGPVLDTPQTVDLGEVPWKDEIPVKLLIRNVGDAPLKITQVGRSCACTSVYFPQEPMAAGATGEVLLIVKAAKFRGGTINVGLHSNDSARTPYPVSIKMRLVEWFSVYPAVLSVHARVGEPVERPFTIWHLGAAPWKVQRILCGFPGVAGSVLEQDDRCARCRVSLASPPTADFDTTVQVQTDSPRIGSVSVPLRVRVIKPVRFTTPASIVSFEREGSTDASLPAFTMLTDVPVAVTNVSSNLEFLVFDYSTQPLPNQTVQCRLDPLKGHTFGPGIYKGHVSVFWDGGGREDLPLWCVLR